MFGELLDDFSDPSAWSPVASGQASLAITRDGTETGEGLRLDFDFKGGGGFVVARRKLDRAMPESFSLHLRIRGKAPRNKFEFKLCDPSGRNVWWFHRDEFPWPSDWQEFRIDRSQIEFAWGPRWGEELTRIGAVELVIAAGEGGAGSVWIADLRLQDHSKLPPPRVQASGWLPGCPPSAVVMPGASSPWHSDPADPHPWITLDFGDEREYGGIVVDWLPGRLPRGFRVEVAGSGGDWSTVYQAPVAGARISHVYLPACRSRRLRLAIDAGVGGVAIRHIAIKSFEYSRSLHQFFQQVARACP
ncbi:MAG: discoidin domain-containing protein, partial [Methylococcaceae bacterium]|nr:discoidin domain-containing protein [Methylococcaceae bacterium]